MKYVELSFFDQFFYHLPTFQRIYKSLYTEFPQCKRLFSLSSSEGKQVDTAALLQPHQLLQQAGADWPLPPVLDHPPEPYIDIHHQCPRFLCCHSPSSRKSVGRLKQIEENI